MLVPSSYHPHLGGVERVTAQLARGLLARGHDPVVVTNRAPRDLPATSLVDDVEVVRIPFRTRHRSLRGTVSYALLAKAHQREFTSIAADVDLINVHCVSSNADYARVGALAAGKPLVVTTHGELTGDATGLYQRDPWAARAWRELAAAADLVTAPSADALHEAERFHHGPFRASAVIPNGVDLARFGGPRTSQVCPYVLVIGRLVENKGFGDLIERWGSLPVDLRHRLVVVGAGPDRERLEALRTASGVAERIEFLGEINDTSELVRGASAVAVPSHAEAFGLVVLEAMAAGAPVIASAVGGIPEILTDGATGLLVEPGDPARFIERLAGLLRDVSSARSLALAAQTHVQAYGWAAVVDGYLAAYESVLA